MTLELGQTAPDFTLPSNQGGDLTLSTLRGKNVILYFYPKDNTPGCTMEAKDFQELYSQFKEVETEVIGVSPDDLKKHGKFCEKHQLEFPLLADTDHAVCELYGVWKEKNMYGKLYWGVERSTFIIDKEGTIRGLYPKVKVKGHAQAVLEALKAL